MSSQYEVLDPATLEVVAQVPENTAEDTRQAALRARAALRGWRRDRGARAEALVKIAEKIEANLDSLGEVLSREQGKPVAEAKMEFTVAAGLFRYYATLDWDEAISLPERDGRNVEVLNRPVGVVGTITPWNFPISLLCVKLAPALIAGCTVLTKPAPTTPASAIALIELMNAVLPEHVVQVLTGSNRTVSVALASEPLVNKISYTGSTAVGTSLMQQAAENVTRVTMELGGNDAAIVLEDADIEVTARGIVGSAFRNAGQVCMAVKRVYVPEALRADFTDAVLAEVNKFVLGHGIDAATTLGPMHNASQRDFVRELVDAAATDGATVLAGQQRCELPGYFQTPTIVADAEQGMRIVWEEQFGAALPIVTYSSVDEAIELANDSEFGLGASIWTPDVERARQLAPELEAGTVWINQHTVVELDAPFGGWRQSGVGRERGRWGLDAYLEPTTVNWRAHQ
ncbi:aldehyde dehydrogenase family protein [Pseudoglutamicibacter albus]|uniref:Aldehyde dehydrogenase n=1 Tax=Pseudoglutamicibacter albus DNF00011 TaxID=1401063 RepID=A0A095YEF6_9MICC|nr:aldehyde dehydrogenase family protein [Pseudoglutamicibacter albus]KGF20501.1 aldehyde dehydrogenase [Pseudoglutamicibacter albus DNF00011]